MLERLAFSCAGYQVVLEMGRLMIKASPLALATYHDFTHSVLSSRHIYYRYIGDLVVSRSHQALPPVPSSVYVNFCCIYSLLRPCSQT